MNQKTTYDPMLRAAMEEVTKIMKQYDIGGFVTLESGTHSEFMTFIEPSWSLASWVKDGYGKAIGIHFKMRGKSDPANTDATAGMLYSIRDLCTKAAVTMDDFAKQLEKQVTVEHTPFGGGINNDDR